MPVKALLRRGCGCVLILFLGIVLLLIIGWTRTRSEPPAWKQQQALLETRTEEERRELAERVERRLRRAAATPSGRPGRIQGGNQGISVENPTGGAGPDDLEAFSPETAPGQEEGRGSSRTNRRASPRREGTDSQDREKRPSRREGERQVTLHLDELNALLQERVARWEGQRQSTPLPVRNPLLAIEGDHLVLFFQLSNRGSEMLLSLPFDVTVDDRGGVAQILGVRLGQLPLPGLEALPRLLRSTGDPGLAELAEKAEAAAGGYPFDPTLEIENGIPLRVLGLEIDPEEQALHLTIGSG